MTALPTWEEFMLPVLTVLSDGEAQNTRSIRNAVSDFVALTDEQRTGMLPSGRVTRAADRISWALHFLHRVRAIERPRRATYMISDRGRTLLANHADGLTERDLKPLAAPGDEWWIQRSGGGVAAGEPEARPVADAAADFDLEAHPLDPYEQIAEGVARIRNDVASQLLSRLHAQEPAFFEEAVVTLLLAMGYGGVGGRGVTTALSNDGGIDGVIDQDVLGLRKVYVQAKRYSPTNAVGRPDVQSFVGALAGRADSGVFITTSRFSRDAVEYVRNLPTRIVLVDGPRLAELMIEHTVGVQVSETVRIVELDEDFFT
jgi:restriction system protein